MTTFTFDQISTRAFTSLIDNVKNHGVEFFWSKGDGDNLGTFRSLAGAGTFAYDGNRLTVTILRDNGHFSRLMIKGGLRQLVSEAMENQPTVERTNLDAARIPTEAN